MLDVQIRLVNFERGPKAFAKLTIDNQFVVDGLKVMQGPKGPWVAMPATRGKVKDKDTGDWIDGYKDVCYPITKEFRQQLHRQVLEAYDRASNQSGDSLPF